MNYFAIKWNGTEVLVPEAWFDAMLEAGLIEYLPRSTAVKWVD